jgi:hypothetical protein
VPTPRGWTKKDERKYEHVKDSVREQGRSEDKAQEIAARTVNKARRQEGRTPNVRTQGTGNPNRPLPELTRDELYNRAKDRHVKGRSRMSKQELIDSLR